MCGQRPPPPSASPGRPPLPPPRRRRPAGALAVKVRCPATSALLNWYRAATAPLSAPGSHRYQQTTAPPPKVSKATLQTLPFSLVGFFLLLHDRAQRGDV